MISTDTKWQAFCNICYMGESGVAIYACFPLFYKYHDMIVEKF